jgi:hypothetical protein
LALLDGVTRATESWSRGAPEVSDKGLVESSKQLLRGLDKGGLYDNNRGEYLPEPDPRLGREWLTKHHFQNADGREPTEQQSATMGLKIRAWDFHNDYPRPRFPQVHPLLYPDGTPQPEPEHITVQRTRYTETVERLRSDRLKDLTTFATTGSDIEEGLGLVQVKADPVTEQTTLEASIEYRDKTLGGLDPLPQRTRGKPFGKGFDPRRWKGSKGQE